MVRGKFTILGWAAIVLLATPALAAGPGGSRFANRTNSYESATSPRKVKVWRGEDAPAAPTLLASNDDDSSPFSNDSESVAPVPETVDGQLDLGRGSQGCGSGLACGNCGNCSCCRAPYWAHRSSIYAEFLYLRPRGIDMAHAMQQNGVGGPGTVPDGHVATLAPIFTPAYRFGFWKAFDSCASIGASYTNYDTHVDNSLAANQGVGNTVQSLVLHPNSVNAGSTSSLVGAGYDINYQLVDIDYRRLLSGGSQHWLNYDVGVRYANLQQKFVQLGDFTPPTGNIQTNTDIGFDGVGLKTGFDGQHHVGCSGFSFYGKGFISLLFGEFNSSYVQRNNTTTVVQANSTWTDNRVVPILEYELGINWTSRGGHWVFSTGYYTAFWFNIIDTPQYVQAVQNANFVNLGECVTFDGLVSRVEFRF